MAVEETYKPDFRWDQTEFEKLKATWSPERIAADERRLKEIFALAAHSPTMKQALDWAHDHGIKFFIDRQAVNCGGYYQWNSGVFAITDQYAYPSAYAVNAITHELRHAWQDYNGFLAYDLSPDGKMSFTAEFINTALTEADATAFGGLAEAEYIAAKTQREITTPSDISLRRHFLDWFNSSRTPYFYGDYRSKHLGRKWGIYDGQLPTHKFEFERANNYARQTGININNINDVIQLGVNFSGTGNYLAELPPDILPKKILRPSLADTFWGTANVGQRKLTTELRKAHLRKKLAL